MALYIQFSSAKTHETMQKTALKVTLNEVLEQMLNFRSQFEDETKKPRAPPKLSKKLLVYLKSFECSIIWYFLVVHKSYV